MLDRPSKLHRAFNRGFLTRGESLNSRQQCVRVEFDLPFSCFHGAGKILG